MYALLREASSYRDQSVIYENEWSEVRGEVNTGPLVVRSDRVLRAPLNSLSDLVFGNSCHTFLLPALRAYPGVYVGVQPTYCEYVHESRPRYSLYRRHFRTLTSPTKYLAKYLTSLLDCSFTML